MAAQHPALCAVHCVTDTKEAINKGNFMMRTHARARVCSTSLIGRRLHPTSCSATDGAHVRLKSWYASRERLLFLPMLMAVSHLLQISTPRRFGKTFRYAPVCSPFSQAGDGAARPVFAALQCSALPWRCRILVKFAFVVGAHTRTNLLVTSSATFCERVQAQLGAQVEKSWNACTNLSRLRGSRVQYWSTT